MSEQYFVYVWQAYRVDTGNLFHYVGHTNNLDKRIQQHKQNCRNKKKLYSRNLNPETIHCVFFESFSTRAQAMKQEKWFKTTKGRKYWKSRVAQ